MRMALDFMVEGVKTKIGVLKGHVRNSLWKRMQRFFRAGRMYLANQSGLLVLIRLQVKHWSL